MSTDAPRFEPEPSSFTPAGDADLVADPTTGTGPDGTPIGADTGGADVNATAGGDAPDEGSDAPAPSGSSGGSRSGDAQSGGSPSGGSGSGGGTPGVGSPEKDPSDWVTGDEPMTGPQGSYLSTLAREAGEEVPEDITKAQASQMIDDLQERTGRGS